jgi:hypothetical protein
VLAFVFEHCATRTILAARLAHQVFSAAACAAVTTLHAPRAALPDAGAFLTFPNAYYVVADGLQEPVAAAAEQLLMLMRALPGRVSVLKASMGGRCSRLQLRSWDLAAVGPQHPALAALLPRLQQLSLQRAGLLQLLQSLRGHPRLAGLHVQQCMDEGRGCWQQGGACAGTLSSLPSLRQLTARQLRTPAADQLLLELSGCAGLQLLALEMWHAGGLSGAGLGALASGPCSGSLAYLELSAVLGWPSCRLGSQELSPLLGSRLCQRLRAAGRLHVSLNGGAC